ncbi:MAG TPA: sulfide/dihydroorotate dehydrogenase-like FAD/NAD-binding protein [candidate division WOR-3 bacterium]|uniref:Sulfide/dihydroorotate dehydrogenase-like FAD/NAD-binding protein n=1 Tax=candidate division WOR-3 bacterium TaxID=2052148 RepID=A0A7C0ZKP9_UNCW3|nr:sulfide/dihydroorotate dehydrogenase-like FAD/NAD-binding protein [candidate division WOR-3 bacterium]
MFKILEKEVLGPHVNKFIVEAPLIAKKHKPGQFVVLRLHEKGERIPVTIAETDREKGTITLIVQEVGKTTYELGDMEPGDSIMDVIGPLGKPAEIENFGTVVTIGGGVGTAIVYPETKAFKEAGNYVISIIGFRNKDLIILEEEMKKYSDELYVTTDDGSYGMKGFVSDKLKELIDSGKKIDLVVAIGPAIMMKVVCDVTRDKNIKTIVSLNSIMVDGTGMCGACRVEVGGETKFACVDGPEFDGHLVNFDLLLKRLATYREQEKIALERYLKFRGEA